MAPIGLGAFAQDYPSQPIRMIVPFAAGGPNDTVARLISPKLSELLGQPVVIENRGGAGGVIGTDLVAKAEPDGYLIGISSAGALAISASVQATMPYDSLTDLTPITLLGSVPELLVANPNVAVESFDELIAYAADNPGIINYASSGPGGMQHLAGELLNFEAEIDTVHVPYSGAAPAVTDLLGGQVQMMFADLPVLLPHVEAGTLRPLAVGSARRAPTLPDVPTTAELGFPEVVAENWYGIIAPAGLPEDVATRLQDAFVETLNDAGVSEALAAQGINVIASTPDAFADYMAAETEKWASVVELSGAVVQ
ncbi:tripartite tricarboxylate transporter substrate binding protein [Pelagibacterium halotolerans]|nr:tripartite tricarboxylate transporter substrate binding protein [Pelagibacterium halotolerans]